MFFPADFFFLLKKSDDFRLASSHSVTLALRNIYFGFSYLLLRKDGPKGMSTDCSFSDVDEATPSTSRLRLATEAREKTDEMSVRMHPSSEWHAEPNGDVEN